MQYIPVLWPEGCAVFLNLPTGPAPEQIPTGRNYDIEGKVLKIFDGDHKVLRIFNFDHVLVIAGLETMGPSNAHN